MADRFLALSADDRRDALEAAATASGRPAYLLEKDVWVVWALDVLFAQPFGEHLVFKGGTSLSKAHGDLIQRFSEDIDLTYDIRQLIAGPEPNAIEPLPASRSQERKWTSAVRKQLPIWIQTHVVPALQRAIEAGSVPLKMSTSLDKVELHYEPVNAAREYVRPMVLLEFGARSSGEPAERFDVACDASALLGLEFPQACPRVMRAERTFWEKATAAHVYCHQDKTPERFARHWHDMARLDQHGYVDAALAEPQLAEQVAAHKQMFFECRSLDGSIIQYADAIRGGLRIVPCSEGRIHLAADYQAMIDEGLFDGSPLAFDALMEHCSRIEAKVNAALTAT